MQICQYRAVMSWHIKSDHLQTTVQTVCVINQIWRTKRICWQSERGLWVSDRAGKYLKETLTDTYWRFSIKFAIIRTWWWFCSIECKTCLTTICYNISILIGIFVWPESHTCSRFRRCTCHRCKIKTTFIRMEIESLFLDTLLVVTHRLPTFTHRQPVVPPLISTKDLSGTRSTNEFITNKRILTRLDSAEYIFKRISPLHFMWKQWSLTLTEIWFLIRKHKIYWDSRVATQVLKKQLSEHEPLELLANYLPFMASDHNFSTKLNPFRKINVSIFHFSRRATALLWKKERKLSGLNSSLKY